MKMPSYNAIVIHFGEIWLKGKNRSAFVNRLLANINSALKGEAYSRLANERDRFMLYLSDDSNVESILEKLRYVFGLQWFAPVIFVENDMRRIVDSSKEIVRSGSTVRIVAHRSFKQIKFTSMDIVKAFINGAQSLPFFIDKDADEELFINVTEKNTLMHTNKIKGPGGLPVGSAGRAVILFSGGIDSPVAAYYAMKRGLFPIYLHVHALQSNDEVEKSKIGVLMKMLSKYCSDYVSYYVPAHVFQAKAIKTPGRYELVLFKRFLIKLAERVAKREIASTIVTGESLSQVASQTVKNLIASEYGCRLLIMRPLIGLDKKEIVDKAVDIGTFDVSKKVYRDVCSLRARNPSTGARADAITEAYRHSELSKAVTESISKSLRTPS